MCAGSLGGGARNRSRSVQHKPSLHARTRVAVGLIHQACAQQIGAIKRRCKAICAWTKASLIIVFSHVDTKLGPCANANVIVVIGMGFEAGQAGLIGDACGLINAKRVVESIAIGANRKAQFAVAKQTNQGTRLEVILQYQPHIRGTVFPV